jgi:hypothetical protein
MEFIKTAYDQPILSYFHIVSGFTIYIRDSSLMRITLLRFFWVSIEELTDNTEVLAFLWAFFEAVSFGDGNKIYIIEDTFSALILQIIKIRRKVHRDALLRIFFKFSDSLIHLAKIILYPNDFVINVCKYTVVRSCIHTNLWVFIL